MDRVFSVRERPYDDVAHVAVAICLIDADRHHIGLLHRDPNTKEVLLLDLAWHLHLRNSLPAHRFHWVDPPIPVRRARQVAALCRKIWRSNELSIPYAFSAPNDCFDARTGAFLLGPTRHGLTCATFVLAVFHAAGLRLIDYDTWPSRPDDEKWQREILALLAENGATTEHLTAVQSEVGATRYRPIEVAGAATQPSPTGFERAKEIGDLIGNLLKGYADN